jgi:hypothetical protein
MRYHMVYHCHYNHCINDENGINGQGAVGFASNEQVFTFVAVIAATHLPFITH